jgi:hypothetical protein
MNVAKEWGFHLSGICDFKQLRVGESGRNSAFFNRCAIDLSSSIPWHGVDQLLASEIIPGRFQAT